MAGLVNVETEQRGRAWLVLVAVSAAATFVGGVGAAFAAGWLSNRVPP